MYAFASSTGTRNEHGFLILVKEVDNKRIPEGVKSLHIDLMEALFLLVVKLCQTCAPMHKGRYF